MGVLEGAFRMDSSENLDYYLFVRCTLIRGEGIGWWGEEVEGIN